MAGESRGRTHLVAFGLLAMAAAVLWLPQLGRSLWLDETGTYWVVSGDFSDVIHRAARFQGQSPLFFIVEWLARVVGQGNEIVLRIPSVLFMGAAAVLLYRLIVRLVDDNAAVIGCAVFVTSWKIVQEANDARPYALAIFATVAAMHALIRWFETARMRDALLYAVFAALTIYAHYLFGIMFVVHVVFALEMRRRTPVTMCQVILVALAVLVLLLPLVPQFLAVLSKRGTYSWAGTPSLKAFAIAVVPPVTAVGIVVGVGLSIVVFRARVEWQRRPPLFLIAWLVTPPLVLFLLSRFTPTKLFTPQYVMASEPAVAILAAWYLRGLRPLKAVGLLTVCLVLATIASHRVRPVAHEDWRGAVAEINRLPGPRPALVMCDCGFVESHQPDWLRDPERLRFLNAPLAAYPPHGDVLRLPSGLDSPELILYAEQALAFSLGSHDRIAFLGRGNALESWRPWLASHLTPHGFISRPLGSHRGVSLMLFERVHIGERTP